MTNSEHAFLSLPAYWDGIAEALSARLSASKKYLRHPVAGFSAEGYYIDLLREYVPKRYAVESGFVINAAGNRSQHLDIIVADTFHIPPLCSERRTVYLPLNQCARSSRSQHTHAAAIEASAN